MSAQQKAREGIPVKSESDEVFRKQIESMIDSVKIVTGPDLHKLLTVQSVYHFLRLPDSSFGWSEKAAMPYEAKFSCVAVALRLGLDPGLGVVKWLGTGPYVETAGLRHVAQSHPEFRWSGPRSVRPLNDVEKELLDITGGDRALVIEQEASIKGEIVPLKGFGILEKRELDARGQNGKPLPGRGSKKDIYQTLVTRAERDILKHHLPLCGAKVAPEPDEIQQDTLDAEWAPQQGAAQELNETFQQ